MARISLVISDVDGTLVTKDKVLTDTAQRAVARLGEHGIGFTVISSRPPLGMRMLVSTLDLRLPIGAYNGGMLVNPDMTPVEQHLIPVEAAKAAVALFHEKKVDAWLYDGDRWLIQNPDNPHVAREIHTIQLDPDVVESLDDHIVHPAKIVGVSEDHDLLSSCEPVLRKKLNGQASLVRSQSYYLDITPPGRDKGTVVRTLSARLAIPAAEIVTLGDMENDVPMFRESGFSIAMGNAEQKVKAQAMASTGSNEENGFAAAIEDLILPWANGSKPVPNKR